jgi:hypothetical protein
MFDRATCATVRVLAKPLVELSALRGLRALLTDTTKDRTLADSGSSNTPVLCASMGSHDQNRGETMRGQQHRRHQHRRGRQQFDLFMEADNARRQRTRLGHAAGTDAPSPDGSHGAVDSRSQRQRTPSPFEGDAP